MSRVIGVSNEDAVRGFEIPDGTGIFETWAYIEDADYEGAAIDLDGNTIVVGSQMVKLNSSGAEIWDSGALGFIARRVAVDSVGNIFVAHDRGAGSSNTSISKYDTDGNLITRFDAGANGRAVFVGPDDKVYLGHIRNNAIAASFASVRKFNNDLDTIELSIDFGNHARAVYVADEKIYVAGDAIADTGAIARYSVAGSLEGNFGPVNQSVNAILVDADGAMYLGGTTAVNFIKYDSAGDVVWTYVMTTVLIGSDFDADGNIYIASGAGAASQGFMIKLNTAGTQQWKTQKTTGNFIFFDVRTSDSPRLTFGSPDGGPSNSDSMFLVF